MKADKFRVTLGKGERLHEMEGEKEVNTEYTEWQRTLSDVHSIMMEKLTQPGEGGGCTPTPFHYFYRHVQVVVYSPAERADTPPPHF